MHFALPFDFEDDESPWLIFGVSQLFEKAKPPQIYSLV